MRNTIILPWLATSAESCQENHRRWKAYSRHKITRLLGLACITVNMSYTSVVAVVRPSPSWGTLTPARVGVRKNRARERNHTADRDALNVFSFVRALTAKKSKSGAKDGTSHVWSLVSLQNSWSNYLACEKFGDIIVVRQWRYLVINLMVIFIYTVCNLPCSAVYICSFEQNIFTNSTTDYLFIVPQIWI